MISQRSTLHKKNFCRKSRKKPKDENARYRKRSMENNRFIRTSLALEFEQFTPEDERTGCDAFTDCETKCRTAALDQDEPKDDEN
ncbi:hypothetical protein AVEN_178542-1 [Araneus ventricosus]|uniref:Uncharacterized protein n=1 Tax=Araneus ventricosus TaxID=182803 RepID=A0A4Y2HHK3_ARAVE|nr:hypothetical protein AVEN_178542-1 [Araneus ventricosus]